jgi:multidrug efflux pump subunit AcrA (membrane-fusion protein)
VIYIYPYLTAKTRTARLRLEFANPGLELKPGMYANVNLKSTLADSGIVVPQEAVIDSGVRKVVFVALGKGKYEPRVVTLGVETDHHEFQVIDGLKEGDEIVVSGQFMFDSESRLREAIQKMLAAKKDGADMGEDGDMDMGDFTMEDNKEDLDMSDLTMDDM